LFFQNYISIFAIRFERSGLKAIKMSKVCQISGKRPRVGNNVSHSNNKTKRKFNPNIQKKRFYIPEEDRWVTLKVSTSMLRTINKNGITAEIKKAKAKGRKVL
jgi:large subunit ribosomal protein L28